MRYNPFQPNKIVNPAMFVGRLEEIHKIEHYLFQAKSGNSQNFLIDGERGIGKSSLLHYISAIATGRITGQKDQRFSFLLLSVDMGGVVTQLDIVRAVAREFRNALSKNPELRERAKQVLDFLTNWEILGVRYHKTADKVDPEDAKENLVDQLAGLALNQSAAFDGILVVIDEADAPTRRQLIHESRLKETTINNALAALKQKAIILSDESRQGFYRLPTRSFAAWINALKSAASKRQAGQTPQLPLPSEFIQS